MRLDNRSTSKTAERTLAVVEALAQRERMSCADVARCLRIPKTSAWYILHTLEEQGYLVRDPDDQRYCLGMKMVNLGQALTDRRIKRLAVPLLSWLKEQTHLSTGMSNAGIALHCPVTDMNPLDWDMPQGRCHTSPCAKLSLAYLPEPEVVATLRQEPIPRGASGDSWPQLSQVMAELGQIRQQGYVVEDKFISGIRFIVAPVFGSCGHLKGSMGVAGFVQQIHRDKVPQIGATVKYAAGMLVAQLSHRNQVVADEMVISSFPRTWLPRIQHVVELPTALSTAFVRQS
jgi:DNA-binding IclR family transcriptional regulator